MNKAEKVVREIRTGLIDELISEVKNRFGGNKSKAAEAVGLHRIQFTNLCNGKDGVTIDKLIQIGVKLGWKITLHVERDKGDEG